MQTDETTTPSPPKLTKKKSTKYWWCIGLALLFVLAAFYYVGGRAVGTAEPWVWNRGDVPVAKQSRGIPAWLGFTISAVGTSAASSYPQNALVDLSSIAVLASDEHPLSIACAKRIAEKLKTIPAIQRIEFVPHGTLIGRDEALPPWIVRVGVGGLNEWTMPIRSLSGNIYVSFGTAAATSNTFFDIGLSPLVRPEHSATNNSRFTHVGIASQSIFYDNIAEDIAKRTVEAIAAAFNRVSQTASPLPQLPEAFYPPYREASELPPIPGLVSKRTFFDGRRFMLPHHSLAQIESNFAGTDDDFLVSLHEAMSAEGWEGRVVKRDAHPSARSLPSMRLTRGNETFHMFQEHRFDLGTAISLAIQEQITGNAPPLPPLPSRHVFLLERMDMMDRDSEFAAIQTLLDENASPSTLLPFASQILPSGRVQMENDPVAQSLREQMRPRLLDLRTSTPAEQLALVRFFVHTGDTEIAKEMLFKAWQVRQLTLHPRQENNYTALARQLGVEAEMRALPLPTAELVEQFGFILLTPENCPMEIDIEVNREAKFAAIADSGDISLLQFTVHYENGRFVRTESMWATFHLHGHTFSSSISTGPNFMNHLRVGNQGRVRVGDQEGTFYFSLISEPPQGSEGPLRVRIDFR